MVSLCPYLHKLNRYFVYSIVYTLEYALVTFYESLYTLILINHHLKYYYPLPSLNSSASCWKAIPIRTWSSVISSSIFGWHGFTWIILWFFKFISSLSKWNPSASSRTNGLKMLFAQLSLTSFSPFYSK